MNEWSLERCRSEFAKLSRIGGKPKRELSLRLQLAFSPSCRLSAVTTGTCSVNNRNSSVIQSTLRQSRCLINTAHSCVVLTALEIPDNLPSVRFDAGGFAFRSKSEIQGDPKRKPPSFCHNCIRY